MDKINEALFEIVLTANSKYVDAVNTGASAQVQEALQDVCAEIFNRLILGMGLANEYAEYCKRRAQA